MIPCVRMVVKGWLALQKIGLSSLGFCLGLFVPERGRLIPLRSKRQDEQLPARNKKISSNSNVLKTLARSERFELPTLGIEIRCSIQLSYERVAVE